MMNAHDIKSMNRSERSALMTRYILGQLSEDERARLEEEYFADSDSFEEMVAVENDLIDSYVAGRLSGIELHQFENHFLSSQEHRERVEFARSLLNCGSQAQLSIPSSQQAAGKWRRFRLVPVAARFALASILVALLACGAWLAVRNVRLRQELAQLRSSQTKLEQEYRELEQKNRELLAEVERRQVIPKQDLPSMARAGEPTIVLTLSSDLTRGHDAKPNILPLSSGVTNVVLMLESDSRPYASYDISVETPGGMSLLHRKGLKSGPASQGSVIAVQLPVSAFARGDYVLRLMGVGSGGQAQEIDAYSFRVVTSQRSEAAR